MALRKIHCHIAATTSAPFFVHSEAIRISISHLVLSLFLLLHWIRDRIEKYERLCVPMERHCACTMVLYFTVTCECVEKRTYAGVSCLISVWIQTNYAHFDHESYADSYFSTPRGTRHFFFSQFFVFLLSHSIRPFNSIAAGCITASFLFICLSFVLPQILRKWNVEQRKICCACECLFHFTWLDRIIMPISVYHNAHYAILIYSMQRQHNNDRKGCQSLGWRQKMEHKQRQKEKNTANQLKKKQIRFDDENKQTKMC